MAGRYPGHSIGVGILLPVYECIKDGLDGHRGISDYDTNFLKCLILINLHFSISLGIRLALAL